MQTMYESGSLNLCMSSFLVTGEQKILPRAHEGDSPTVWSAREDQVLS